MAASSWRLLALLLSSAMANQIHLGLICMERSHAIGINPVLRETCDHVRHAVDVINNKTDGFLDSLLPNHQIVLHEAHPPAAAGVKAEECISGGRAASVLGTLYDSLYASAAASGGVLSAILGGHCSGNLAALSNARGGNRTVLISASSTAVSPFDDEAAHPNVVRVLTNEAKRAPAFAGLADQFGWQRIGLIDDGGIWGTGSSAAFRREFSGTVVANATVLGSVCSSLTDANWTAPEVEAALDQLHAAGTKVIFASVSPKCARIIFGSSHRRYQCSTLPAGALLPSGFTCPSYPLGGTLHGEEYAWMLSWMSDSMISLDDGSTTDLDALYGSEGALGIQESILLSSAPMPTLYAALWNPVSSLAACSDQEVDAGIIYCDGDDLQGLTEPDIFNHAYHALWVDAVLTYATAIDRLLTGSAAPMVDAAFYDALYNETITMPPFQGMSGLVDVGTNGDRDGSFQIKNVQILSAGRSSALAAAGRRRGLSSPIVSMFFKLVRVGVVTFAMDALGLLNTTVQIESVVKFGSRATAAPDDAWSPPPPDAPPSPPPSVPPPPFPPPLPPPAPPYEYPPWITIVLTVTTLGLLSIVLVRLLTKAHKHLVEVRKREQITQMEKVAMWKAQGWQASTRQESSQNESYLSPWQRRAMSNRHKEGEDVGVGKLKVKKETTEFYFIDAEQLRKLPDDETMPTFRSLKQKSEQQMEHREKPILVKLKIRKLHAFMRLYKSDIVVVSHRWEEPEHPDPKRTQFTKIQEFLRRNPSFKFVWVDFSSMPQGADRTEAELVEFRTMLSNVNLLYLGCSVLILLDGTYLSRFWTQFEAWLSMRTIELQAEEPLRSATVQEKRYFIECLHSGDIEYEGRKLEDVWGPANLEFACRYLQMDDVMVTNKSDKEQQIEKLKEQFDKLGEEEYRAKLANDEAQFKEKVTGSTMRAVANIRSTGWSKLLKRGGTGELSHQASWKSTISSVSAGSVSAVSPGLKDAEAPEAARVQAKDSGGRRQTWSLPWSSSSEDPEMQA